ncbi:MAG: 2-oxo acid dehydrogenase subunit E2 [Acidobacteria bacterium]|nr:2-oxo acid dehydrogenase subunit E2 [Acidobacteriota bacterium]
MRYIFKFPDIGEGIHEGKILQWYVEKGQSIQSGDPVVQMETDKVVADIPSPKTGVISARFGKVGEIIHVEDPLVEIDLPGVEGEEAQAVAHEPPPPRTTVAEPGYGVVGTIEVAGDNAYLPVSDEGVGAPEPEEAPARPARKVTATPTARAMARELGVDLGRVAGTGPGGRVLKEDVQAHHRDLGASRRPAPAAAAAPEAPRVEAEPLSQIRKAIARNMSLSKHNAAHMTLLDEVEVDELVALRERLKAEALSRGVKLTYMAFILRAVTEALKRHRSFNAELDLEGGRVVYKKYYNLGVAVDAEEGLVVPVIRDTDRLSITELALRVAEVGEKARQRKLTLDDFRDGTFTVTNFGALGGWLGVPVINYPQAAILGVGRLEQKARVRGGAVVPGWVLPLSLSVDHRLIDGGEAVRFLVDVMATLREPVRLLLA